MAEESLFSGESKNIEYKVAVPKKSEKYMKTVVAFANGNGGKIVFGIDDNTLEIVGMDEDNIFKTMDAITNAIVIEAMALWLSGALDRLEEQDDAGKG